MRHKIELLRQEKALKEDFAMMDSDLSPHGRVMSPEGEKLWVQRQLEDVQYR